MKSFGKGNVETFSKYCRKYNVERKYVWIYENGVKEFVSCASAFFSPKLASKVGLGWVGRLDWHSRVE